MNPEGNKTIWQLLKYDVIGKTRLLVNLHERKLPEVIIRSLERSFSNIEEFVKKFAPIKFYLQTNC